ncbi:capsid protein [Hyphomicrobium nitrativorans NL23]|uniref:Capsid protein n=2 Tax=Hyphomicrobium TaxID=81 RepID=V5S971_9HYPH|nr:capsid protein [Hyphomicrobium nitrativorans NL23]
MKPISIPARAHDARIFANAAGSDVRASLDGLTSTISTFRDDFGGRLKALEDESRERSRIEQIGGRTGCGDILSGDARSEREAFAAFGRGIRASMGTDNKPDGGYLVPRTVEQSIARLARDATPMRSIARVVTTDTSAYVKCVSLNGPTATWVGEREARNQTPGMKLSELEFPVWELQAMPAVTQTLIDDAFADVAAELSLEIATAFSEMEDTAFVHGTGIKQPKGFLSVPKVADPSWAWGKIGFRVSGVAAALSDSTHNGVDALYDLYFSLKATYRANASWLMNSSTAATVAKLKDDNENYLWQPSIQVGQPATLLGRPVVIDENMPSIEADATPIAFGDFERGYLIVDRTGIRVLRDPYSTKPYVLFYTTKRVGGGVQDYAAIKLLKIAAS